MSAAAVARHLACICRKIGRKPIAFHVRGILREFHPQPNPGGLLK
ncbi:MAG TPA: hypothetical protein VF614_13485 [Chthoniobacteraceae bacterium]